MSARRPCLGPGGSTHCPTASIAPAGRRRCPRCDRAVETTRSASPARQIYRTSRWRTLSERVRAEEPACYRCGAPSTTTDHVVPLEYLLAIGGDPYDRANLHGCCAPCQNRKGDQHQ